MNINSIFRDTVNQLTTGAGKVINNIVDFFSNLSSGITGIFNSNIYFRQVKTEPSFISHTPINFVNNKDEPIKSSLGIINEFLNKCENNSNMIENKYSEVVYCMTTSNDKSYYTTLFEGQTHNKPSEKHIYTTLFEGQTHNKPSEKHIYTTLFEGHTYSIPFEEHTYSILFEDHIYSILFEEHTYSILFEDHTYNVPSKEDIYDKLLTESKTMEFFT
ncbi:hypothetical protein [Proteus terrae]|uniref:hypothetical protein n=1 Tax=Proteus terrae TaxID=1574161 RepID=UPI0032DBA4CD